MEQIDEQRVAEIALNFLKEKGTMAITSWTPTAFDKLQGELNDAIMEEYPRQRGSFWFRITFAGRAHPNDPREFHVEILRVLGQITVKV